MSPYFFYTIAGFLGFILIVVKLTTKKDSPPESPTSFDTVLEIKTSPALDGGERAFVHVALQVCFAAGQDYRHIIPFATAPIGRWARNLKKSDLTPERIDELPPLIAAVSLPFFLIKKVDVLTVVPIDRKDRTLSPNEEADRQTAYYNDMKQRHDSATDPILRAIYKKRLEDIEEHILHPEENIGYRETDQ
jgi:hypothetical protein